jgi:hypothetical protein
MDAKGLTPILNVSNILESHPDGHVFRISKGHE